MMPKAALADWLRRVGDMAGAPLMVSADDLAAWPTALVDALQAQGMLVKAMPASSVVCPGCERACVMPVEAPKDSRGVVWPFVMCDKRSDTGRVPVPVGMLERWKSSVESVAQGLAKLLDAPVASAVDVSGKVWAVGSVRGKNLRGRVELKWDGALTLWVAGRQVPLADVLSFDDAELRLDVSALGGMADRPIALNVAETAKDRAKRLALRMMVLKGAGVRGFRKTVQEEEGISPTRLRQILAVLPKDTAIAPDLSSVWGAPKVRKPKSEKSKKAKR